MRRVCEKREVIDVTYRIPWPSHGPHGFGGALAEAAQTFRVVWVEIGQLAGEIGRHWKQKGKGAAEAVSEGRRE